MGGATTASDDARPVRLLKNVCRIGMAKAMRMPGLDALERVNGLFVPQ